MNRFRDVILIIVAVGLLVAVFWPNRSDSDKASEGAARDHDADAVTQNDIPPLPESSAFPPASLKGVFHPLFPFVEGATWTYLVTDSSKLSPADTWSLKIVKAPAENSPGVVAMGFGDKRVEHPIHLTDGGIQVWELPFEGPLRYPHSEGTDYSGNWLPMTKYIINGAVWESGHRRNVLYQSRDKANRIVEEKAVVIQTDRAQLLRQEKVIVPAGVFQAHLVSWLSRMEIRAGKKGRRVLERMTTEPFKKETIWFAPEAGMLRRRVTYSLPVKRDIIFALVRYTPPPEK